ncbi:MAG: agmatinase family protein [Desulfamplus sp.]|nr:agmatinase family protein [Desulfamplus sp.]
MESSVSYRGGTSAGPHAILDASNQLEAWDSSQGLAVIHDCGIYTARPVDCNGEPETVLERIEKLVARTLQFKPITVNNIPVSSVPVLLGGEHTVTLGALRAIKKHLIQTSGDVQVEPSVNTANAVNISSVVDNASAPFGIIQIDAHADLRDSYEGSRLSHACVMRRAVEDLDIPLFQIGVRAISHEEVIFRSEKKIPFIDAREIYLKNLIAKHLHIPSVYPHLSADYPDLPSKILSSTTTSSCYSSSDIFSDSLLPAGFPEKIYITLDVDGLDPSVIRATGTPVPGGIGWHDTLTLLECVIRGREVVGFDVVELAPVKGDHASDFAAAQLVYSVMGMAKRLSRR